MSTSTWSALSRSSCRAASASGKAARPAWRKRLPERFPPPGPRPAPPHRGGAVPGLRAQEVRRAQDPRLLVEVGVDVPMLVGVIAERDDVDARLEELPRDLGRDAEPARRVLAVDDDEVGRVLLPDPRQEAEQRPPARRAHDVADEEDADGVAPALHTGGEA